MFGIRVTIVEPGNFRTDFAGDVNMRPERPIPAYRPPYAPIEDFLYGQAGRQPGDPAKAAEVMIAALNSPSPPLRLMVGVEAYDLWDRTISARNAELALWRERGEATAFPESTVIPIRATPWFPPSS